MKKLFTLALAATMFVDDRQINVDEANAAGMPAVLFTDAHQLENDLNALGVRTR